jgi:hypothetical protein
VPAIVVQQPASIKLHLDGGPFTWVGWDLTSVADPSSDVPVKIAGFDCEPGGAPGKYLATAWYLKGRSYARTKPTPYEISGATPSPSPPPTPAPAPTPAPRPRRRRPPPG